ncbi:related to proteophosphoglycan ppg1-Leishmania major [Serendipita indica DSM 11827]|uniref:Related to proteophosphoglycan ppg1-Leishmania major n=1 Tax=Serendipita indica (strain DSM 11827) TaxID=1109443 RepID=G4TLV6_SERID|nr:related to proteophosphoglycan ppg1-Leishmania major [Serendipita indica DSM 11827]
MYTGLSQFYLNSFLAAAASLAVNAGVAALGYDPLVVVCSAGNPDVQLARASSSHTVYEPSATLSSESSSIVPSSTSAPSFNPPPPSSSDPLPPSSTPYTPPYTPPETSSTPYTPPYTPPVTPSSTRPYSSPPLPPFTPSSSPYSPWSYDPPIMSSDTLSISVSISVQPPYTPSSSSSSTPAPTGPTSTLTTMSTPQPPPSSSSSTGSSSSASTSGGGGLDTVTSTSSSASSSSPSSSSPDSSSNPSSSSSSSTPTSSSSSSGGGLDTVTTTSASSSSSPSDTGGSSPSSSSSTRTSTRSDNDPSAPSSSPGSTPQNDSVTQTRTPTTTFSTPVSLTMTNSQGSVFVTSPSEITTVVVTTVPNGSFTTLTEIIANPPGVLNSGDRSPASTFFKNRGAVAGVFVTAALALCAMILFVVFALRRRRQRLQRERDAEIAAGLAAAAQRFTDDGDHPVVMRSVPSSRLAMRRSPLPDDEDDDERIVYSSTGAPIMYSNPHMMPMAITRDTAYPVSPARYGALGGGANRSRTPSPSKDPFANPIAIIEPASPVANANSGWSSHGGFHGQRSQSVSPVPTMSAPASAHHGTNFGAATSIGHAPSSYHTVPPYRPPTASSGKDGSSGSGGSTSVPGTIQPPVPTTSRSNLDRSSSPALSSMYPPEYEQFASVENGSGNEVGYAYEPEPVQHSRQITAGLSVLAPAGFDQSSLPVVRLSNDDDAYSGIRSPLSGADLGRTASVGSRSMYSQDASAEWDEHERMPREDPRLDPLMRMHGGLVSAASMGQTDHLDYMRRVQPQALNSPSTLSHSQSTH